MKVWYTVSVTQSNHVNGMLSQTGKTMPFSATPKYGTGKNASSTDLGVRKRFRFVCVTTIGVCVFRCVELRLYAPFSVLRNPNCHTNERKRYHGESKTRTLFADILSWMDRQYCHQPLFSETGRLYIQNPCLCVPDTRYLRNLSDCCINLQPDFRSLQAP